MALRRGGLSLWQFFSQCHREFGRDLAAMEPQQDSLQTKRHTNETGAPRETTSVIRARLG
jgi:hypothetical protein